MLLHLPIFFSHINLSFPSYSAGKLTIRMIHVHVVIYLASHRGHSMSNEHKKILTLTDLNETWFYTVSVEILTHSEFQHSAMYGFRVTAKQKIDFSEIFSLPIVTKSTITLSEIDFMTYNLHHL